MRKYILLLVCFLLLVSCAPAEETKENDVQWMDVYFIDTETGMLSPREFEVPSGKNVEELIGSVLHEMTQTPKGGKKHESVFPARTGILGVEFENSTAEINFSKEYLSLEGFDRVKAECAIVMTLSKFWDVKIINIHVEGELLTANLNRENIITELPKKQ